jgi:serine/threonine protein kinase
LSPELEDFLTLVVRSGLADRSLLTPSAFALPTELRTPQGLSDALQAQGVLTSFQADKLLGGSWQGLLLADYQLLYPIGRGGMGMVYLARDGRIKPGKSPYRHVALKLLPPRRAQAEPRMLARFQHELQITAQLPRHPLLPRTLDSGTHHGVTYLSIEYVMGKSARQLLQEQGRFSVARSTRICADLATALHAVHQVGLVHRDVKPSNVIVSPSGRGRILDFGFALHRGQKAHDDPSILGGVGYTLGTIDYLPPEQAINAVQVGPETDVYSLGCSLFMLLTGHPPFPDGTPQEKIRQHRSTKPRMLNELNPEVPENLARYVNWLLAKRPEERPQSMAEVARELEKYAELPEADRVLDPLKREAEVLREAELRWQSLKQSGAKDEVREEDLTLIEEPGTNPVQPGEPPFAEGSADAHEQAQPFWFIPLGILGIMLVGMLGMLTVYGLVRILKG